MKKVLLIAIILIAVIGTLIGNQDNKPVYQGRVNVYLQGQCLCFEYRIDSEIGDKYSHFTRNGKFYKWEEVKNKNIVMWLNHRSYKCSVNKKRGTIFAKVPINKILKKNKTIVIHFSWVVDGKYYSLVNQSPFACKGNKINRDYHFEAKVIKVSKKIVPFEDY